MSDDHGARGLDFQIGDWRVIREDTITQVMKDQFESDLWVVGCASAEFLSRVTGLSSYIFEALQKRDAQEEIGMIIQDMNKLDDYVDEIIKGEGYGPHFASYDGQKHEVKYLGNYWYLFQVG